MFDNDFKIHLKNTIISCVRNKFSTYKPETINMPFHYRLLGKDRMALFSFIQSLNTTFGISIYEPVAKELAKLRFKEVHTQFSLGNKISSAAQQEIQKIMNDLSINGNVDKKSETERIRMVSRIGEINTLKSIKVDLMLVSHSDEFFYFDLKTVKPNKGDFISYKRNLLEWLAISFFQDNNLKINTSVAIPYNPYSPEPYKRWTMKGMLDFDSEIVIGEDFWNLLAGKGTYNLLLDSFEAAGIELREEIDEYFKKFNNNDISF